MPRDGCNIEPNGKEWTCFQSIGKEKEGCILVFRKINAEAKKAIETWLPVGKKVSFMIITGDSKIFERQVIEMEKVIAYINI